MATSISTKNDTSHVGNAFHPGSGLCFIFTLYLGTPFINMANCSQSAKSFMVSVAAWKGCKSVDFKTFKLSNLKKKSASNSASVCLRFSEELHQTPLALQVLQDALALRDERFSAPSSPSPKICQGKGFLKRLFCCLSLTS